MLRDAPQRTWAMEAPALGFRCDAPQHEGEGRRILANEPNEHFGQTKPSGEHARERRTNPRLCEMTAGAISLFRVVIYNEVCNPHVPAALSAQDLARQHARTRAAGASSIYLARRFAVVSTGLCWCVYCAAKQTAAAAFNAVLVRRPCAFRSAPTVSCDEGCAAGAMAIAVT
jgi:hypothetical protein